MVTGAFTGKATMATFRYGVAALPQILLLLLIGGWLDALGGLNHTDFGLGLLFTLFLLNPVSTLLLLGVESLQLRTRVKRRGRAGSTRWRTIATILFLEALVTDMFILSETRIG